MKLIHKLAYTLPLAAVLTACGGGNEDAVSSDSDSTNTEDVVINETYENERIADLQVLSYEINGFDRLSLDQKKLVYYLYEAGLSGRDMIWDQNYRHNLAIRNTLEDIVSNYKGDKESEDWSNFMEYTGRVWFSNGIHHHYSMDKFIPKFSRDYFETLLAESNTSLDAGIVDAMFDPEIDAKRVSLDPDKD